MIRRQEFETILFGKSIGLQGRALRTRVIEEIIAIEARGGGLQELIPLLSGERIKEAWENGNVEYAPLMVGQSIGLIKKVLSCKELLDTMAKEAAACLARVNKIVQM
jgi:nitronate monooxygenase